MPDNELSIQLGVELDQSSLGNIKQQIDDIKGGKNNNINLSLNKDITNQLTTLKKNIDDISKKEHSIKFNIDQKVFSDLQNIVNNLNDGLSQIGNKVAQQVQQATEKAEKAAQQTQARTVQANIPASVPVDKYTKELNSAIERYQSAFSDSKLNLSGYQIMHDELSDSYRAAVQFNNALGETTSVMFKLQSSTSDAGEEIREWVTSGQRFSASFKDSGKEIESTLDTVQNKINEIQSIYSKAFDKNAFKTLFFEDSDIKNANFAQPVLDQYNKVVSLLGNMKFDAEENGISATKERVRELNEEISRLNNVIREQKNARWTSTDFKETDTSSFVERYRNALEQLSNELKDSGVYDKFAERIENLNSSLDGVSKNDISTGEFINQLRNFKQEIDTFSSSYQGKAMKLSFEIDTKQIQQIENTINRLNSIDQQYSGTGVQALKQNLQDLATEYQNVMTQLQSADLTQEQFDALSQKVQELGNQLKQAADKAKIFDGSIKSDDALKKYEQNAESVRMKFEQLQRQYENLAKSNPQIAQRFQEVQNSVNNMDPANISEATREVNNFARELQSASGQSAGLRGALQDAFGGVGSYLARFTSAYYIISKGIQGIKSMVSAVKEVDSALLELQKVTSLSGSALDEFTDKAYKVGASLGRTGSDVIDAAATFSRAGYDLQEATQLAQSALVMTNVGVDIQSTEAAASDMISILKAFDVQANESMDVIDKLYNVANKEPLDFGNLTQMLVTAGGTLAQTGTSLEETMGLLTGAYATMRDTSVANG